MQYWRKILPPSVHEQAEEYLSQRDTGGSSQPDIEFRKALEGEVITRMLRGPVRKELLSLPHLGRHRVHRLLHVSASWPELLQLVYDKPDIFQETINSRLVLKEEPMTGQYGFVQHHDHRFTRPAVISFRTWVVEWYRP
jgi:hypothetical protein